MMPAWSDGRFFDFRRKGKVSLSPDSDNAEILKDYVAKIWNNAGSRVS